MNPQPRTVSTLDLARSYATPGGLTVMTARHVLEQVGDTAFAWLGRLPLASLTIIGAEQGVGKSVLSAQMMKTLTVPGTPWPDGQPYDGPHGRVMLLETDGNRARYPVRLDNIGCDMDALVMPTNLDLDFAYTVDLDRQFKEIELLVKELGCVAVFLDSLSGGRADVDENSQKAGRVPDLLQKLALACKIPVIAVHHLRKKSADEPDKVTLDRFRGSTTITQPARSVLGLRRYTFGQGEDAEVGVVMEMVKWSFGTMPPSFGFIIEDDGIVYRDAPEYDEVMPRKVIEKARAYLREVLRDGPKHRKEVLPLFLGKGFSSATMDRAAREVGVLVGGGVWALPRAA